MKTICIRGGVPLCGDVRIHGAKNSALPLLRNPGISITKIVDLAGFPTIRTFNRVFLQITGVPPRQYRKK